MTNTHGLAHIAWMLLAAVVITYGVSLVIAADPQPAEAVAVATPNHDPYRLRLKPAEAVPVPAELAAWNPELLRAEPEEAVAPSAPTFAPSSAAAASAGSTFPAPSFSAADTMLYARANARLRAAPDTGADVVTKLAANAPLRAVARSFDGSWWQVAMDDQRTGFVHRDAVYTYRLETPVAAAYRQPAPVRRGHDFLSVMTQASGWLADMTGLPPGSPRKTVRPEH